MISQSVNAGLITSSIKDDEVIKANFVMEKFFITNGRLLKSSGESTISKKLGICWKITKPIKRTMLITSDSIFDLSSSKRDEIKNKDMLIEVLSTTFVDALSNMDSKLYTHFEVINNYKDNKIFLRPKDPDIARLIFSINIVYNEEFIEEIQIVENTNSYTKLIFSNQALLTNPDLNAENYCSDGN
ncbi:MAG: outer-membrane lipoprotein carrier protein LolA [Succinivibrionaceae bacterium]|nr:outer-membrane lipoprotein carrier protein LolA [Succinivibrionaceae bacterium]